jgi:RNA polymerase sigma-70 factor (ECF subfamily)
VADELMDFGVGLAEGAGGERDEDDASLADALRQGDEWAYEGLIQRFQQPIFNLVSRLLWDPNDVCDVVQEVFLKVFRKIGSFRGESSLKTWIYRIAVNEAYNHRRWFSRHQRQEVSLGQDEGLPSFADTVADPARTPFDQAADHETRALVEKALEKLNPKFRAAVVLRDIEELSYEEIAAVLEISLGTVKSRIVRGREALRKNLEGRLELEPRVPWGSQPLTE